MSYLMKVDVDVANELLQLLRKYDEVKAATDYDRRMVRMMFCNYLDETYESMVTTYGNGVIPFINLLTSLITLKNRDEWGTFSGVMNGIELAVYVGTGIQ